MKRLSAALVVGVMVLGIVSSTIAQTITTSVFPLFTDGRNIDNGAPFTVYIEISNWAAAADSQVNVRVTTESGTNFLIWNDTAWKSAYTYSNCPVRTINSSGNWSGWIYLRAKNATDVFKAHARDVDNTNIIIHESDTHSITYMNMSTTGAWVYATAASATAGKAVLAFDGSNNIIGTYAIEDNGVDEGYSSTAGYFKIAVAANTSIAKLQVRNSDNSVFNTQTSSTWSSGDAGTDTDLDAQQDVTLPVELNHFSATAGDKLVALRWITESEVDNQGFNIYRSRFENRDYQQITSELIPGAGNSAYRNEYEYVDKGLTNGVTYWYKLEDVDYDGLKTEHGPVSATPTAKVPPNPFAGEFHLSQNYPNPFNPLTTIDYQIPEEGKVVLGIYNLLGQPIRRLVDTEQDAGDYQVEWDGRDGEGSRVVSGIYFYRLKTGEFVQVKKMVFLD